MRIAIGLLLVCMIVTAAGCAVTYRPAPYEEQLWALATSHGYEQVFHTRIAGHGMCAVVLVSGTGSNRVSAKINAYRRGVRFFNASIGVPILGEVVIEDQEVITHKERMYRVVNKNGDLDHWRADSIVIAPLSGGSHHHHH